MVGRSRSLDAGIALGAALVLLGAIWYLVRTVMRAKFELIPSALVISPTKALSYSLICLVVGGLTMAFVQVWRSLVPIRGFYQRAALSRFLEEGALSLKDDSRLKAFWDRVRSRSREDKWDSIVAEAMFEFEHRSNMKHGSEKLHRIAFASPLLFDLPIEQLCGQLNVAFETALASPERLPQFLLCIVGADGLELLTVTTLPAVSLANMSEDARNVALLQQAEARAYLSRIGQQRIDTFQINAGGKWRRHLRKAVLVVSLIFSWQLTTYNSAHENVAQIHPSRDGSQTPDSRLESRDDSNTQGSDFDSLVAPSSRYDDSRKRGLTKSRPDAQRLVIGPPRNESAESRQSSATRGDEFHPPVVPPTSPSYPIEPHQSVLTHLFQALLMGIIATYVAMILRDLAAIVETKRRQS